MDKITCYQDLNPEIETAIINDINIYGEMLNEMNKQTDEISLTLYNNSADENLFVDKICVICETKPSTVVCSLCSDQNACEDNYAFFCDDCFKEYHKGTKMENTHEPLPKKYFTNKLKPNYLVSENQKNKNNVIVCLSLITLK